MKTTKLSFGVMLFVIALCFTVPAFSQQAVYFPGENQYLSFPGAGVPAGNSPRTIELWMRSNLTQNSINHQPIINLGKQGEQSGSAFGLFTEVLNGKTYLSFWGHNVDARHMTALPDDEWHFVSLSYDGGTLRCYLNGILKYQGQVVLQTQSGTCYIGGNPDRNWFFNGSIRSVSIWNTARSQTQIQSDMLPYFEAENSHTLKASEPGLAYHFPLNEGSGTSFKALGDKATGSLVNGPIWTTPINSNPAPIDEGIWFFIQNKADVDADTEIKPRRMAMTVNSDEEVVMAPIPVNYTEDYAAWLWRAQPHPTVSGTYHLINKKLGSTRALDCSMKNPTIGSLNSTSSGQAWSLPQTNVANYGTNVYTMTNKYIEGAKDLQFASGLISVTALAAGTTNQAWVFQPVMLHPQYHIPAEPLDQYPTAKKLTSSFGVDYYATYTCSDWSILNTHLIINNQMNALKGSAAGLRGQRVYIISRYDANGDWDSTYAKVGIRPSWINPTRGGQHSAYNLTMVTEEMMCRRGVYWRINDQQPDLVYREYDQLIHEFGHTIDAFTRQNGAATPSCSLNDPYECYAASVQAWFNNDFSYAIFGGMPRTRKELQDSYRPLYDKMLATFNVDNTWLPPRFLHERISKHVIPSGTTISVNDTYLYESFSTQYALRVQTDGNVCIKENGNFKWGSFNNYQVPLKVNSMLFVNGTTIFMDASGNELKRIGINGSDKDVLIIRTTPSGIRLQVLSNGGTVLWTSE